MGCGAFSPNINDNMTFSSREPNKTRVASYIQTDLGGMLPKPLVESALPSNVVDFFTALKAVLQEDGKWKGAMNGNAE